MMKTLRIATRKSPLALWQAKTVQQQLAKLFPKKKIELIGIKTQGDQQKETPLSSLENKDFFVKELQLALLNDQADIAVHSLKDLSAQPATDFTLAAMLPRADPRDVLINNAGQSLKELATGSIIGSSSPRRQSLLLNFRPDLIIRPIRGNIQTRIQKMQAGQFDGIILAAAGIKRLELSHHINEYLDVNTFTPAIGQGIIAIECLSQNTALIEQLRQINHTPTERCAIAERAVNTILQGGCQTPLAAHATLNNQTITVQGMVGSPDGKHLLRETISGPQDQAKTLGVQLADQLLTQGANALLKK